MSATAVHPGVDSWRAIGTTCLVAVTEPAALPVARDVLRSVLDEGDLAMSRFRDDSELCRLPAGVPTRVSPMLAGGLAAALYAARATDGLVDPTVGAGLAAAGYDRDFPLIGSGPTATALPVVAPGWRTIGFDPATATVIVPSGVIIDLGATGKAYLADLAAQRAAYATGVGVLVSLGGDVSVAGEPPAGGWSVRVSEDPDDLAGRLPGQTIGLAAGGLATSSTLLRRWRQGASEMHHILDPATGLPAAVVWRTVSVAAATCVDANTATTAAVVLGTAAPQWLQDAGLPARLVHADGRVVTVGDWPEEEAA